MNRRNIAGFLQGFFVMPVCALFGGLIALLFRWEHGRLWLCLAFCVLFPLAGALKTRQGALLAGLLTGLAATFFGYLALHSRP